MKRQEKKGIGWKGSYTVETALLMGILLPILFGILWVSLFLYEYGVLQGAASESVFLENRKVEGESVENRQAQMRQRSLEKANLSLFVERTNGIVSAWGNGQAMIPGILSFFWKQGAIRFQVYAQNSDADGTKKIRAICQEKALLERRDNR